jgi:hypothetical protein
MAFTKWNINDFYKRLKINIHNFLFLIKLITKTDKMLFLFFKMELILFILNN